jgi:hypothetical protein
MDIKKCKNTKKITEKCYVLAQNSINNVRRASNFIYPDFICANNVDTVISFFIVKSYCVD